MRVEIGVREAAERLGVDDSRVRQMLRAGRLVGRHVSGRWLVDDVDLARLRAHSAPVSRPMAPTRAWGLLDLLDGGSPQWLTPSARSQVRALLRTLPAPTVAPVRWRSLLAARATVPQVAAHPAAVQRLLLAPGVVPAGVSAAIAAGADLVSVGAVPELYVAEHEWADLVEHLRLNPSSADAAVLVRVPRQLWPFPGGERPGRSALAADLLDSVNPRAISAGAQLLAAGVARFVAAGD